MNIDDAKKILRLNNEFSLDELKQAYMHSLSAAYSEDLMEDQKVAKINSLNQAFNLLNPNSGDKTNHGALVQATTLPDFINTGNQQIIPIERGNSKVCPDCEKKLPENALTCSYCQSQIARYCLSCGQIIDRNEQICPRCGVTVDEYDKQTYLKIYAVEKRVEQDRNNLQIYTDHVEQDNRSFMIKGLVYWLLIIVIIFLFFLFAVYIYNMII